MKGKMIRSGLLGIGAVTLFPITSLAGDLNGNEQSIVGVINGTFEKDGITYVAKQEYINAAVSYMLRDDVNLTAADASKAISSIYANVQTGIDEGYIREAGRKEPGNSGGVSSNQGGSQKKGAGEDNKDGEEIEFQAETDTEREAKWRTVKGYLRVRQDLLSARSAAETDGTEKIPFSPDIGKEPGKAAGILAVAGGTAICVLAGLGYFFLRSGRRKGLRDVKPLFDLHTHFIPDIDDGSPDMKESLEALEREYRQGVRTIICTSHVTGNQGQEYAQKINRNFTILRNKAEEVYGHDLKLYLGNEILYSDSISDSLKQGSISTMAGSHYVLIEFSPKAHYEEICRGIRSLVNMGYLPILAHVERYFCLRNKEERLENLREMGAYFQVNASMLTGRIALGNKRDVRRLVKNQKIHFLSTDSHGISHRPPQLKEAAGWVFKNCESKTACRILYENPQAILDDKII